MGNNPKYARVRRLSRLDPSCIEPNQAAQGAGQTNDAVVQVRVPKRTAWYCEIAEVGDQLELSRSASPKALLARIFCLAAIFRAQSILRDLLDVHRLLAISSIRKLQLTLLPQIVQRIHSRNDIA
jgi:hypothetical protein